jgi:hypothetical protein
VAVGSAASGTTPEGYTSTIYISTNVLFDKPIVGLNVVSHVSIAIALRSPTQVTTGDTKEGPVVRSVKTGQNTLWISLKILLAQVPLALLEFSNDSSPFNDTINQ